MSANEALQSASAILRDEANELALLSGDEIAKKLPHRARVAIRREIERLREIAAILDSENQRTL